MSFVRSAALSVASVAFVCVAFASTAEAGQCRDPWVTQAIQQVTGHQPTGQGETGDCYIGNYGGGHWGDYNDLVGKVRAQYPSAGVAGRPAQGGVPQSSLVQPNRGAPIISNDGASAISHDGSSVISRDGAGLVGNAGGTARPR